MNMGRRAGWGAAIALLLITACSDPAPSSTPQADPVAAPGSPALLARGRAVYNFRCYYCHGYSGDAKTLAATYISPPPRNFQAATTTSLPVDRILVAVREGIRGTAMKGFSAVIPEEDIRAVSAFVFDEFVLKKAPNTRYHTPENGWPNHERYRDAFPFAQGDIELTRPAESLEPALQRGRQLYLSSCVTCHDRGKPVADSTEWDSRPLSFPRYNFDHKNPGVDAATSATPYRLHDVPPPLLKPTPQLKRGEKLFQDNCAFCHAADGTGKNWIGAFMEPHPRNLRDPAFMGSITQTHLKHVIRNGLKDTSMPAWGSVFNDQQIDDVAAYINAAFHSVAP